MRRTITPLLLLLGLTACGTDETNTADTSALSITTPSAPTEMPPTTQPDRMVAADQLPFFCALDGIATNASTLVRLQVDRTVPLQTSIQVNPYSGAITRSTYDVVWSDPSADIVTATVSEIIAARADDPRGDTAPEPGTITLVQHLLGSFLPELWESGDTVVAAIGPWGVDGAPAWRLHAAATEAADGSLSFSGPCANELDGHLAAVAAYRGAPPTLALLGELVVQQLQPGASADLRAATDGFGWDDTTSSIPPSLVGRVRVSGVVYVPHGSSPGLLFIRSGICGGASSSTQASTGPFPRPFLVTDGLPVELHLAGDDATWQDSQVIASVDSSAIGSDQALVAEFDSDTGTGTFRVVGMEEFSTISGMSVQSLADFRARFEASLVADQTVAQPELYGG